MIEAFIARHRELPVELLPYAPEEQLREHLCSADVHLVMHPQRREAAVPVQAQLGVQHHVARMPIRTTASRVPVLAPSRIGAAIFTTPV